MMGLSELFSGYLIQKKKTRLVVPSSFRSNIEFKTSTLFLCVGRIGR